MIAPGFLSASALLATYSGLLEGTSLTVRWVPSAIVTITRSLPTAFTEFMKLFSDSGTWIGVWVTGELGAAFSTWAGGSVINPEFGMVVGSSGAGVMISAGFAWVLADGAVVAGAVGLACSLVMLSNSLKASAERF